MASYRTVLFDLDGTLLDSVRLILDSYHHTLAVHGLPARSDDEWLAGIGTPLWAQFRTWSDDPAQLQAMILTYREYNLKHHDDQVAPFPGVVEAVRTLRTRGARTGLVTSKNRTGAVRGLAVLGLEETIDVIVGADEVTHAKPHPEPVLRALELLGEVAGGAVFVGDSVHDMASGRAAGVATAAVLWGPFTRDHLESSGPDHWLEQPGDLLTLVDE